MLKKETAPSESEWQIMEVFWSAGTSLTSSEVILRLKEYTDMTPRMVRVLDEPPVPEKAPELRD
ncbi:hypothetical protein C808_03511 [Lachnospiraceae bacterium M18-1]|nr:hypothetical protein C808_03511 [Lachnospiraceae bacterium M18-1]